MDSSISGQRLLNKNAKIIQGKNSTSTNGAGATGCHRQKNEVDPSHSKWVEDLNVRATTVKLSEENIRVNLRDLGLRKDSETMMPKA